MLPADPQAPRPTLYAEMAERMLSLIERGTYREGDRVPSIRALSQRFEVSVNTIKEAYQLLESQRFLEAKPQSGYYVRRKAPPLPRPDRRETTLQLNPKNVSMCRIYGELMQNRNSAAAASLAIALPDSSLLPARKLEQALLTSSRTLHQDSLAYVVAPGFRPLREQIAQRSLEAGLSISPDDIVITSGASEAILLALITLVKPGETIAVESPTYFNFLSLLHELGYKVLEIPASPDQGLNLEVLEWALERHSVQAILAIPNFSNPLGYRMNDERKRALVELAESRGVPLIEDDIYGELPFAGRRPLACKSFDRTGNVLLVSSFSKTLAPGYRVGWIVPGRWTAKIDRLKSLMSVATSTPPQMALARYLEEGNFERHLRNLRQRLADQTGLMAEVVAEAFPEGTKISRPSGGFVLWLELAPEVDTLELFEIALREGLVFSPGEIFSGSGRFKNCLRLNAGVWNPAVERAVRRLGVLSHQATSPKMVS